jgi:hypothetical protein
VFTNPCERVTDGARTRALRSHNPTSPVSGRCQTLQNRLRYADSFARGCPPSLCVAPWVVSGVVSKSFPAPWVPMSLGTLKLSGELPRGPPKAPILVTPCGYNEGAYGPP